MAQQLEAMAVCITIITIAILVVIEALETEMHILIPPIIVLINILRIRLTLAIVTIIIVIILAEIIKVSLIPLVIMATMTAILLIRTLVKALAIIAAILARFMLTNRHTVQLLQCHWPDQRAPIYPTIRGRRAMVHFNQRIRYVDQRQPPPLLVVEWNESIARMTRMECSALPYITLVSRHRTKMAHRNCRTTHEMGVMVGRSGRCRLDSVSAQKA
mmetsp:Transcript_1272/g.1901  ORF Transcript_1272/g.1901 Transcript_1272/m.1901 type:complete len:216 (+) Transcript_1272:124-771(+)